MGSSLGRLDGGEEANIETMKVLIEKYEEIKRDRGSSDDGGEGATSSVVPSISDRALYRELEQALVAARTAFAEAAASEGTTASTDSSGSGSSSSGRSPRTVQDRHQRRQAAASTPGAHRLPSVLIVDDSDISCQIAKRGLSNSNIGVKVALSGERGLEILNANPSAICLVLLDVVMPGIDGLEVLDRIKKDSRLCHVPVVVLSGLEDDRIAKVCKQHGAVEVLRKPMSTSEVVRLVNAHCSIRRSRTAALSAGSVEGASTSRSSSPGDVRGSLARSHTSEEDFPPRPPPPPPPPDVSAVSIASVTDTAACGGGGGSGGGGGGMSTSSSFSLSSSDDAGKADRGSNTRGVGGDAGGAEASSRSHVEDVKGEAQGAPSSATIGSHASDYTAGSRGRAQPSTERKVTILVVDDSAISSRLAIHKLRSLGYDTLIAVNGQTALELLRKHPNRVSFVLLDIIMPVMNGIELLHILKNDPALCHIPVLVVSSLEMGYLDTLGEDAGVLAVLKKPLDVDELQQIVAREGLPLPRPPPSSQPIRKKANKNQPLRGV